MISFWDRVFPGRRKLRALLSMGINFRSSWCFSPPEFEAVRKLYLADPDFFRRGEEIWATRHKRVVKLDLPAELGGTTIVFKSARGTKPLRYALRCTKTTLEAANYRAFKELGIPMATLILAGDERKNFRYNASYLGTVFAEGCQDGRVFRPGEALQNTPEATSFIRKNLRYLAMLHSIHCFHKAARPYNFLWKPAGNGEVDVTWIDVASCRFMTTPEFLFRYFMIYDLGTFFLDLQTGDEELREVLRFYLEHNPGCGLDLETLFKKVREKAPLQS